MACSRTAARALVALSVVGVVLAVILALGLHVNLSASAPRGLYRMIPGLPTRGARVLACLSPQSAALARARGYLGPEAMIVNGQRLPSSSTAASDTRGRELPHVAWGRHVIGLDDLWLISTRVPNSWDSR